MFCGLSCSLGHLALGFEEMRPEFQTPDGRRGPWDSVLNESELKARGQGLA